MSKTNYSESVIASIHKDNKNAIQEGVKAFGDNFLGTIVKGASQYGTPEWQPTYFVDLVRKNGRWVSTRKASDISIGEFARAAFPCGGVLKFFKTTISGRGAEMQVYAVVAK